MDIFAKKICLPNIVPIQSNVNAYIGDIHNIDITRYELGPSIRVPSIPNIDFKHGLNTNIVKLPVVPNIIHAIDASFIFSFQETRLVVVQFQNFFDIFVEKYFLALRLLLLFRIEIIGSIL